MAIMQKKLDLNARIGLIDEIRGFAILCMVAYHFVYDLITFADFNFPIFYMGWTQFLRDAFAGIFIVIAGACCQLSHHNLKRGILCFGCGCLITLVTYCVAPDEIIVFGILHCLGLCMILYWVLRRVLNKIYLPWSGIVFFLTMFFITAFLLPYLLTTFTFNFTLGFVIGLPAPFFYSSDYYPLFPWFFLFLSGSYVGIYLKNRKMPAFVYCTRFSKLAFLGRHTLCIYLFHQPILYGLTQLILLLWR